MPSILVIDDDRLVAEATRGLLDAQGYNVTIAHSGKSGIEAARSNRFDLAIVDVFMPDMDGLQVIKVIRESNPDIPMIAISGFMFGKACPEMPGFKSMAVEAGAVTALYKPIQPDHLLEVIETAIVAAA